MDRRLALLALAGGPLLWAWLTVLGPPVPPLAAFGLGLALTWALMAAGLWLSPHRDALASMMEARSPGRLVTLALALPAVLLGAVTLRALGASPLPPHLILAAAVAAVVTATLEEAFWRGALAPSGEPGALGAALGLYGLFHLGWIGLVGIETGVPPALLLMGTVAMGGAWSAARIASGALGAGLMGHAGLSLFLYLGIIARNWGPG